MQILAKAINYSANSCFLKVNNRNTRKRCEICSKLTIKTPERRHDVVNIKLIQVNISWV